MVLTRLLASLQGRMLAAVPPMHQIMPAFTVVAPLSEISALPGLDRPQFASYLQGQDQGGRPFLKLGPGTISREGACRHGLARHANTMPGATCSTDISLRGADSVHAWAHCQAPRPPLVGRSQPIATHHTSRGGVCHNHAGG